MTYIEVIGALRKIRRDGCPTRPCSPYGYLQNDNDALKEIADAALKIIEQQQRKAT